MLQLICHLTGDYCLQNHWMANTKTRSFGVALVHAAAYMLPFTLAFGLWAHPAAFAVMFLSHAVIDRFQLAKYWCAVYGVGGPGWFERSEGVEPAPPFLAVWLRIIVDNTAHLAINYACLSGL